MDFVCTILTLIYARVLVFQNNKECFSDDVLPNGFSVGKGDIVFFSSYGMGRMEYLWGDDAQVFRPERWLDEHGVFQPESPFKFTAFQVPATHHT
jgi:cytochrome P450